MITLITFSIICSLICSRHVHGDFDLLLLHTNDMHARFEQADVYGTPCTQELAVAGKCYGGFPRLKEAVAHAREEAKKQNVASLYLDAGDIFQGTPYYTLLKWPVVAALIGTIGIDVMSLGNHEFDDGVGNLTAYLNNISLPIVAANLNLTLEPEMKLVPNLVPSVVLQVGPKKIGIIGYITPETKNISSTGSVIFLDEIVSLRKEVENLKAQNVDIIIALGHSGFTRDIEIAKQVPGISLVVGGHSHTLLYSPKDKPPSVETAAAEYPYIVTEKSRGKKVAVVQAYCNTKYLGKLRIKFSDEGDLISAKGDPILLIGSMKEDENLLKKVIAFKREIQYITTKIEGKTNVFLSMTPNNNILESNLGNLITDSMVDYVVRKYDASTNYGWTDASVAIIQGGGIRTKLDNKKNHGIITYGDILTILPFDNELYKVKISGHILMQILEHSAHRINRASQSPFWMEFLQVSGLKVIYDLSKPAGEKVKSALVRCSNCSQPQYFSLLENQDYTIIVSNFMLNGGDGYDMIKREQKRVESIGIKDSDAFKIYIENQKVVYPGIEGRIIVENSFSLGLLVPSKLILFAIFIAIFISN